MTVLDAGIVATAGMIILVPSLWFLRAVVQEYGRRRIPCLLYHQLQPAGRPTGEIDPVYVCYADRFSEQMDYLKSAGYTTLTLDDLMAARQDPGGLPSKPVLVTFDDGFASDYELAFPVLRRNGQRATIFMTPDRSSHNFRRFAHLDRPLGDAELGAVGTNKVAAGAAIAAVGVAAQRLEGIAELSRPGIEQLR